MSDFLAAMARGSERRAEDGRRREAEAALRRRALDTPTAPELVLHPSGFDVIAEVKRHAPSAGPLSDPDSHDPSFVATRAEAYVRGGAAAISVLTEPERFQGTLADLAAAADAVPVPIVRKDFLVDPYQVFEARAAGAGGVLVIVRMLDDPRLREMIDAAADSSMLVLIECFDEDDVRRARDLVSYANAKAVRILIGVNTRNLSTLAVDQNRLATLALGLPEGVPTVAESGIETPEHACEAAALRYQLVLVGSALMRAPDPARLTMSLLEAGRAKAVNGGVPTR